MAIDMQKLRNMQKDITKKASGGGDSLYVYCNKLGEEKDIRLLESPYADFNGTYFVQQDGWWINGEFYLSNSTTILGGLEDVIKEEIDAARNSGDADVIALLDKKKALPDGGKVPVIKGETRYILPVLLLTCKYDEHENLESVTVDEDVAKVLVAKPTVMKNINGIVVNKHFANIFDRVKGNNVMLCKTGKGLATEYSAQGWPSVMEMPEKYYDKIPNVIELTKKAARSQENLRSIIRNYLYGEAIVDAPVQGEKTTVPVTNTTTSTTQKETENPPIKKLARPSVGDSKVVEKETKKTSGGRNLLDDVTGQLDDLD